MTNRGNDYRNAVVFSANLPILSIFYRSAEQKQYKHVPFSQYFRHNLDKLKSFDCTYGPKVAAQFAGPSSGFLNPAHSKGFASRLSTAPATLRR
jgi:hypothetical protein